MSHSDMATEDSRFNELFVGVVSAAAALVGGWALVGVYLRPPAMDAGPTVKASTALCFILAGASLWLLAPRHRPRLRRGVGRLLGALVSIVGAVTLVQYLFNFNWDVRIDEWFFTDASRASLGPSPNRMAPETALGLLFLGAALFLLDARIARWRPSESLAVASATVALIAIVYFVYDAASPTFVGQFARMALLSAVMLMALSLGTLVAQPKECFVATLAGSSVGGAIARRLLPAAVGVPLVLGWLRLYGEVLGLYGTSSGVALHATATVVLLCATVFWIAKWLDRADAERRNTEEELRRANGFLDAIIENIPIMVVVKDAKSLAFERFNRAGEDLLGRPRTQLLGKTDFDFFSREEAEFIQAKDRETLRAGKLIDIPEESIQTRTGSRWLHTRKVPIMDNTGAPTFLLAISEDITDRKRADELVRASEAQFRSIFEHSEEAIVVAEPNEGRVLAANPSACRMFRLPKEELLRRTRQDLVDVTDPRLATHREERRRTGRVRGELTMIRGDESRFEAEMAISTFTGQGGEELVTVIVRDVTAQRQYEESLVTARSAAEAANRELEAFSYSVSHDLRAPLRSIDGFSQALLEDYSERLDAQGQDYLKRVRGATQRMALLIDDLLNLSRVSRAEIKHERIDLSALAREIANELQQRSPARNVTFQVEDGLIAEGDARLIRVVLDNLIGNAWKFTSKKTEATIEFGRANGDGPSSFFVRDNGAGFDPAYAAKLFGAFQRLHASTEYEGTGVGLATVQRIVHRHGGHARAEGEPGRGATFYFSLDHTVEETGRS